MAKSSKFEIVFITAPNEKTAVKIAKAFVEEKLAACVNIVKNIRSIYAWQGKIEDEPEVLIIAKTQKKHFKKIVNKVKGLHSYTVPEIIALPIIDGSKDYLDWLEKAT